jgi:hypothetical protein
MAFVLDTFTGTAGVAVTSRAGEIGATWTGAAGVVLSDENRARGAGAIWASGTPSTQEYYAEVNFFVKSTVIGQYPEIRLRGNGSDTYYRVFILPGTPNFKLALYETIAGTSTFATFGTDFACSVGESHLIKFQVGVGYQKVWLNGVLDIDETFTGITDIGQVGLLQTGASSDSIGVHLSDISVTDTVLPTPTDSISVDNAALYWSKQWFVNGASYAKTPAVGAYLKTKFTGTLFGLELDTSSLVAGAVAADRYPIIKWSIDNAPWSTYRLLSTQNPAELILDDGLADTTHEIEIHVMATDFQIDRWTTPVTTVKIDALLIESGKALIAPTLRSKTVLFVGDSITEGINSTGGQYNATSEDATICFPALVSSMLGWEYAQHGFGSRTFNQAGAGNVPNAEVDVDKLWSGQAHDLTVYDYIVSLYGSSPATPNIAKSYVITWLTNLRAAAPDAVIYVVLPTTGAGAGNHPILIEAVSDFADPFVKIIGPMPNVEGLDQIVDPSRFYSDSIHPNREGHARIAVQMANLLWQDLNPGGGGGPGGSASVGEF